MNCKYFEDICLDTWTRPHMMVKEKYVNSAKYKVFRLEKEKVGSIH